MLIKSKETFQKYWIGPQKLKITKQKICLWAISLLAKSALLAQFRYQLNFRYQRKNSRQFRYQRNSGEFLQLLRVFTPFSPKIPIFKPPTPKSTSRKCLWVKTGSIHLNKHDSSIKNNNIAHFIKFTKFFQNTNITTNLLMNP